MSIVREGSTKNVSSTGQSSSTFNYALIKTSGNNRLVVVGVNFEEGTTNSRYITGVTFNGTSMTQLTGSPIKFPDTGLQQTVAFFYLLDSSLPSSAGSKQLIVSLDGVCTSEILSYVVEYSSINQGLPDDSAVHENESAGNTSVTLTPGASGSLGVLVCGCGNATNPVGNENNLTTVQSSVASTSSGAMGELLNQSSGFTFGYNNMALREGCIGAVWKPYIDTSTGFIYGPYTWNSRGSSDESNWIFSGPDGIGVQSSNTARRWCWNNTDTTSYNVGPTSGQGGNPDGYLYTESSSPTASNDQFTMELNYDLDGSNNITVQLYTNQRGDSNNATCEVQTKEGGAGWITRATYGGSGDPNKVATSGTQIWTQRNVDLTGIVSHAQTRIRFLVKMPSSGTIWHNDYGIDTVTITGVGALVQTHQMML